MPTSHDRTPKSSRQSAHNNDASMKPSHAPKRSEEEILKHLSSTDKQLLSDTKANSDQTRLSAIPRIKARIIEPSINDDTRSVLTKAFCYMGKDNSDDIRERTLYTMQSLMTHHRKHIGDKNFALIRKTMSDMKKHDNSDSIRGIASKIHAEVMSQPTQTSHR
jgi:hypothetical protein